MTPVPHSGNLCSGLCRTPCIHFDCWQCDEEREVLLKKKVLEEAKEHHRVINAAIQSARASQVISTAPPVISAAPPPGGWKSPGWSPLGETTTAMVTRDALQHLVELAGLHMDWNNGDPIIHWKPEPVVDSRASDSDIEAAKKLLEWKPPADEDKAKFVQNQTIDHINRVVAMLNSRLISREEAMRRLWE